MIRCIDAPIIHTYHYRWYLNDLFSLSVKSSNPWASSGGPYCASRFLFSLTRKNRRISEQKKQTTKQIITPVKLLS